MEHMTTQLKTTDGEKAFLAHAIKHCGNQYQTTEQIQYYLADLYTWFTGTELIGSKFDRFQVGGYLKALTGKGMIAQYDRNDFLVTSFGIQYAIDHRLLG